MKHSIFHHLCINFASYLELLLVDMSCNKMFLISAVKIIRVVYSLYRSSPQSAGALPAPRYQS